MEHATGKPSKPSSNISEFVSMVAKVCKLRSIGVILSENPNQSLQTSQTFEESKESSKRVVVDGKDCKPSKGNEWLNADVSKLFDIVSGLKSAYVRLQQAHIPYEPDEIIAADEVVVAQLEALCRINRAYKAKQLTQIKIDSSLLGCLKQEIEIKERFLEKLKSQAKTKDFEIYNLRRELNVKNCELVERLRQRENVGQVSNVFAFEDAFRAASKSIHDFAKPLISLMKATGWDLDKAANSTVGTVTYSKRSDKKYAFEAYIAWRMFYKISFQPYSLDDVMRFDNPIDSLTADSNSKFAKFCREKYLFVVHPSMEASFFGNLDQRGLATVGRHPRTPFFQIFAKMAKWVWILQGIPASVDQKARIFFVKRGSRFSDLYMESVENGDSLGLIHEQQPVPIVEFMITPGFRIGDSLVKSRVYVGCRN